MLDGHPAPEAAVPIIDEHVARVLDLVEFDEHNAVLPMSIVCLTLRLPEHLELAVRLQCLQIV